VTHPSLGSAEKTVSVRAGEQRALSFDLRKK
jgi:hypothetical protein